MAAPIATTMERALLSVDNLWRSMDKGSIYISALRANTAAIIMLLHLTYQHRVLSSALRNVALSCPSECESARCFQEIYSVASKIRDRLAETLQRASGLPYLSPLRWAVEKELAWWDELAENLFLAGDEEFRSLIRGALEKV